MSASNVQQFARIMAVVAVLCGAPTHFDADTLTAQQTTAAPATATPSV